MYDFFLPLKLVKDTTTAVAEGVSTSEKGCSITSNYWADRGMSLLRCKGSFAAINPAKDCRPDKEALVELTKDFAKYKLLEKHGEKIEAKKAELKEKKEELIKKLDEKIGGEGSAEKAKTLLKGLFKKKRDE
jgi:AsmA protein